MDWTQLASLAGYTTAVCYFFYRLNEKSIDRSEYRFEKTIKEWRQEHTEQMKENEAHWREMFMYMNKRIDAAQDVSEHKTS